MKRYHNRKMLLLIGALVLPTLAIAVMGWRILRQDGELGDKYVSDAQEQETEKIRQDLLDRLGRITTAVASGTADFSGRTVSDPLLAFTARVERDHLALPPDEDAAPRQFRQTMAAGKEFARRIDDGERAEISEQNYMKAAALYEALYKDSLGKANVTQSDYARLLLARAMTGARKPEESSLEIYRALLKSTVVDDEGIPLASYAAERLAGGRHDDAAVLQRIAADLDSAGGWPRGVYILKSVVEKLTDSPDNAVRQQADEVHVRLMADIERLEQASALRDGFSKLVVGESQWVSFGKPSLLVAKTQGDGDDAPIVIAVRAGDLFKEVAANRKAHRALLRGDIVIGGAGEPLGENFPNLRIEFSPEGEDEIRAPFGLRHHVYYALSLAVVIGVSLIGGYLISRDARRELRTSELRSQFVSSVSHEVKTPLTAIRMFAETLQMREGADPKMHKEYLETIVSESERLTRLLNNVLDFSSIEQGERTYHMAPTRLDEVIDAATRILHFPLSEHGFSLRVNVQEGIPAVLADKDALEQAILNLLANAMKFSGQSRSIELRLLARDGSAFIEVEDHGVGVAPKEQGRIFERFYRVPTEENRAISGAGIGLALVSHIVAAHGGAVNVKSSLGQGSTFIIKLPIREGDPL